MPCGADLLRADLFAFWKNWDRSTPAFDVNHQAVHFYEAIRHHPYFQREAAVLGRFIESQRELSALLTALSPEKVAAQAGTLGLSAPWATSMKEGQVAA